jgi:HK97 family phage major capsid protein/HK97 family phage prohead protease
MPEVRSINVPKVSYRQAIFERSAVNEEERTAELTISSEAPYERHWGVEILDHRAEAVDMADLTNGAPALFNHDRNAHIGTILEARNDGKNIRIKVKFSKSALGQEKFQDVKDGILTKTSVGYEINDLVLDKEEKGKPNTYRVTKWRPMEGSLVTLPADWSTGLGKDSQDCKTLNFEKMGLANESQGGHNRAMAEPAAPIAPQTQTIDVVAERNTAVTNERKRVQEITDLANHFATNGLAGRKIDTADAAKEFIRDGKTVDDFQKAVILGNFKEVTVVETNPELGMNKKEIKNYSLVRACFALANKRPLEGLEKECSEAAAKLYRMDTAGFLIPHDVLSFGQERALQTNVFNAAGALVGQTLLSGSMIELLRNNMVSVAMGARILGGLQGNLSIPKQTGAGTAYWLAEGTSITGSSQTVGQVSLTPHRLAAKTGFSLQLLAQASVDVENFVREDLMKVLALKKDAAVLNGLGSAGEPLGITNLPAAQLSTPVTLANAGTITYAEAVRFETNVANSNALIGSPGFVTTPTVKGGTKVTAKFTNTGFPVWENDMVNGYRAVATLQNTSAKTVIFGDFAQIIIGDWAGMEVLVDPYSRSDYGEIEIKIQHLTDVAIRQGKAFSLSSN